MWWDYTAVLWQAITIWCAVPAFHDINRNTLLQSALFVLFGQASAAGRRAETGSQGYKNCMAQADVKCRLSDCADIAVAASKALLMGVVLHGCATRG